MLEKILDEKRQSKTHQGQSLTLIAVCSNRNCSGKLLMFFPGEVHCIKSYQCFIEPQSTTLKTINSR